MEVSANMDRKMTNTKIFGPYGEVFEQGRIVRSTDLQKMIAVAAMPGVKTVDFKQRKTVFSDKLSLILSCWGKQGCQQDRQPCLVWYGGRQKS